MDERKETKYLEGTLLLIDVYGQSLYDYMLCFKKDVVL